MGDRSDYTHRYLVSHLISAAEFEKTDTLLSNLKYLELKGSALSVYELLDDYLSVFEVAEQSEKIRTLYQFMDQNAHSLAELWTEHLSAFFLQQLYNSSALDEYPSYKTLIESRLKNRDEIWLKRHPSQLANKLTLAPYCRVINRNYQIVWSLAFSPDGQILATGGEDGAVYLTEVDTGKTVQTIQAHMKKIEDLAFLNDGNVLVTGGWDNKIKLWDIETGNLIICLNGHEDIVRSVAVSPDDRFLISGSADNTVKIWSLKNKTLVTTLSEHTDSVRCVTFSPDSQFFASCGYDNVIIVWVTDGFKKYKHLVGHEKPVWHCSFDPTSKYLASTSLDMTIRIWDVSLGRVTKIIQGHRRLIASIVFSPDGQFLAGAGSDQDKSRIFIWDASTYRIITNLSGHTLNVWRAYFSPDERLLGSCSSDRTARLWDISAIQKNLDNDQHITHDDRVRKVVLLPKNKLLLTNTVNGATNIWNVNQKCPPVRITIPNHKISHMATTQDEKLVALAAEDGVVMIVDPFSGTEITKYENPEIKISDIAFSSDNSKLIILTPKNTLSWAPPFNNAPSILLSSLDHGQRIICSPDQRYLAVGNSKGEISVLKWLDQELVAKWSPRKESTIRTLSFNPITNQIAFTTDEKVIYIWDFRDRNIKVLEGHNHWVWALAYSPDGKWLATGGWDNQIRLWDTQNYRFAAAFVADNPIGEIRFDYQDPMIWASDFARDTQVYALEIIEG